jgi:hypothetical protein
MKAKYAMPTSRTWGFAVIWRASAAFAALMLVVAPIAWLRDDEPAVARTLAMVALVIGGIAWITRRGEWQTYFVIDVAAGTLATHVERRVRTFPLDCLGELSVHKVTFEGEGEGEAAPRTRYELRAEQVDMNLHSTHFRTAAEGRRRALQGHVLQHAVRKLLAQAAPPDAPYRQAPDVLDEVARAGTRVAVLRSLTVLARDENRDIAIRAKEIRERLGPQR